MYKINSGNMNATRDGIRRTIVFLFFLAGSFFAKTLLTALLPDMNTDSFPMLVFAVPFGAVLVLAASVLGSVLIPLCVLFFGAVSGIMAQHIVSTYYAGSGLDMRRLIVSAIVVPAFFLISVKGMSTSAMLGGMLDKYSVSAKAAYTREYIPMTFTVIAAMLAVYFITG